MKSRTASIERLLEEKLLKAPDPARDLIARLGHIKDRAYFNKPEFLQMCGWKSPRPRRLYESNSSAEVRRVSVKVFAAEEEGEKMELLISLKGVGIPTASAILTLTNPNDYGVIDIRVWQQLYFYGAVAGRPSGVGFSCENWLTYLRTLRFWAGKFNVTARDVEVVLFEDHRARQQGRLYQTASERRALERM